MWLLHFFRVQVVLQFSLGCLATYLPSGGRNDVCKSSCFVQSEDGDRDDSSICRFYYEDGACYRGPSMSSGISNHHPKHNNLLNVESTPISTWTSAVSFSFQYNGPGEIILMLSVKTSDRKAKCFLVCFKRHLERKLGMFHASCVKLPNGLYNGTLVALTGPTTADHPTCGDQGVIFPDPASSSQKITIHSETTFWLTSTFPSSVYPWNKKKKQRKRDGLPDILGILEGEPNMASRCPCYACLDTRHFYDNTTALLQLSYTVNNTDDCCSNCTLLNLVLYQYVTVHDEGHCTSLNFTTSVVSGIRLVTQEKNVTQAPIAYPNIGTGCYAFRLRPVVNPSPIYHGFFWLTSSGNVTNMNDWNTTFYLQPYPDKGSLEVKWTPPTYPHNFSSYELQLWHHQNFSIKCRGENLYDRPIVVIPESGKISLASAQTSYHFQNLSSGWYCARVTPVDPRCPPDGCEPRSSLAKLLKDNSNYQDTEDSAGDWIHILIGVAAGVGLLVAAGIVLACVVLRCRASHNFFNVAYSKVSGGNRRLGDTQEVLLVWTVEGDDGIHLLPTIQAFKNILTSYGRCKVYDYLDLRSIPSPQREHLLASPTAWLDGILSQHRVKIIVVGTKGGRHRQALWRTPTGGRSEITSNFLQPLDAQLFPYLLRRLQDRPDLATDYSRVFHVRFSDVSTEEAELEGVVSWTRYRLPEHLRSLILALHGIKDEEGSCLEELSVETMQPLYSALLAHPLYSGHSSANNNSNHTNHKPSINHQFNKSQNHSQSELPVKSQNHSQSELPVKLQNHSHSELPVKSQNHSQSELPVSDALKSQNNRQLESVTVPTVLSHDAVQLPCNNSSDLMINCYPVTQNEVDELNKYEDTHLKVDQKHPAVTCMTVTPEHTVANQEQSNVPVSHIDGLNKNGFQNPGNGHISRQHLGDHDGKHSIDGSSSMPNGFVKLE